MYTLDLHSYKWEILQPVSNNGGDIKQRGQIPEPRDEHTALIYEGAMIIYGGFVNGERTSDIYKYYFKENKWEFVQPLGDKVPPKRAGHSAVRYKDSMFVFGGKDEENNKLNDLWEFNLNNH